MFSLGAGSGADTIAIRQALCPDADLLMIEAQDSHRAALTAACQNRPRTAFEICAAAREDGVVRFAATTAVGGSVVEGADAGTAVPARALDSLAAERGWTGPCFLKFDTHGVEVDILEGATAVLQRTTLVMMEVYNFKLNFVGRRNLRFYEMCLYLEERGLRCVDLCDPLFRPNDLALWQFHLFFIRADHPVFGSNSYSAPAPANR
jgi:FkbM family methyltransferase